MVDFAKKLSKFNKVFKTAKERAKEEGAFGMEYPDGKYKAKLASCQLGEAKTSGRNQVDFEFAITAGEYKGDKTHKYQAVETEDDLVWLARDLARFGIEAPESSEDLVEIVKLLDEAKPELIISLRSKDSGQFCYIDKVVTEIDAGDFSRDEDEGDGDGDDDDKDEDGDADTVEVNEGDEVTFTNKKGKKVGGKVTTIEDDTATVEDEDGKEYEVALDDLELVEGKGKEDKKEDKDKDEDADDDVTLEVGMQVEFENEDGDIISGTVTKILEDEEMVKVKDEDGEIHKVEADKLNIPEEKPKEKKSTVKKAKR